MDKYLKRRRNFYIILLATGFIITFLSWERNIFTGWIGYILIFVGGLRLIRLYFSGDTRKSVNVKVNK